MAKLTNTHINTDKKIFSVSSIRRYYGHTTSFLASRPFTSFFLVLSLLFVVIFVGNLLSRPKVVTTPTVPPKSVAIYTIGASPKASFQAKIDKSGVIKVVALSSGIIQSIYVAEGDNVSQGQQLFTLSTNYQGGNLPALQSQIANAQYKNVTDTFGEQQDIIQKQRDLANASHDNFSAMQNIATSSASQTTSLINANQTIIDQLNKQLTDAKNGGASASAVLGQESQINQLQGAQNQLMQTLSNLQMQTDSSLPPGRLADTQHDLTVKQLDVQEKSLELNQEVSKLQADVAAVAAATMDPASPFDGTVQKIYVRLGQQVNPGTVLAEVVSSSSQASAIVDVPSEIATRISSLDTSTLFVGNTQYQMRPTFIPSEATSGSLYSIIYPLSSLKDLHIPDGQYLRIDIPLGNPDTSSAVPFVPLDAMYQTNDSNYLFLLKNNKAVVQQVSVGNVYGSFAEITSGLHKGDEVILNRNVIARDSVRTQ